VVHRPFDAITEDAAMNTARMIEFLFDFGSPTTYLAQRLLTARDRRTRRLRADVLRRFRATGNQSLVMVPG
jgi:2-hydroxychromene-2-carboxylate isomerase